MYWQMPLSLSVVSHNKCIVNMKSSTPRANCIESKLTCHEGTKALGEQIIEPIQHLRQLMYWQVRCWDSVVT